MIIFNVSHILTGSRVITMQKLARVVSLAVGHRFDGLLVLPESLKTAPQS